MDSTGVVRVSAFNLLSDTINEILEVSILLFSSYFISYYKFLSIFKGKQNVLYSRHNIKTQSIWL